jgi:hypothetical protein
MPAGKAHRVNDQFPDFTDSEVSVLKEIAKAFIADREQDKKAALDEKIDPSAEALA